MRRGTAVVTHSMFMEPIDQGRVSLPTSKPPKPPDEASLLEPPKLCGRPPRPWKPGNCFSVPASWVWCAKGPPYCRGPTCCRRRLPELTKHTNPYAVSSAGSAVQIATGNATRITDEQVSNCPSIVIWDGSTEGGMFSNNHCFQPLRSGIPVLSCKRTVMSTRDSELFRASICRFFILLLCLVSPIFSNLCRIMLSLVGWGTWIGTSAILLLKTPLRIFPKRWETEQGLPSSFLSSDARTLVNEVLRMLSATELQFAAAKSSGPSPTANWPA